MRLIFLLFLSLKDLALKQPSEARLIEQVNIYKLHSDYNIIKIIVLYFIKRGKWIQEVLVILVMLALI